MDFLLNERGRRVWKVNISQQSYLKNTRTIMEGKERLCLCNNLGWFFCQSQFIIYLILILAYKSNNIFTNTNIKSITFMFLEARLDMQQWRLNLEYSAISTMLKLTASCFISSYQYFFYLILFFCSIQHI